MLCACRASVRLWLKDVFCDSPFSDDDTDPVVNEFVEKHTEALSCERSLRRSCQLQLSAEHVSICVSAIVTNVAWASLALSNTDWQCNATI